MTTGAAEDEAVDSEGRDAVESECFVTAVSGMTSDVRTDVAEVRFTHGF